MTRVLYDLDVLRTFCTGVELGSFARAADKLGRSTSAVSAQLKKLESQCGTPLLRKSGRGLVLTEAGETLRGYALRLLELNDRAVAAVRMKCSIPTSVSSLVKPSEHSSRRIPATTGSET